MIFTLLAIILLTVSLGVVMYYMAEISFIIPWEKRDFWRNVLLIIYQLIIMADAYFIVKFHNQENPLVFYLYDILDPVFILAYVLIGIPFGLASIKYVDHRLKKKQNTA
jgi:hypothetical protein